MHFGNTLMEILPAQWLYATVERMLARKDSSILVVPSQIEYRDHDRIEIAMHQGPGKAWKIKTDGFAAALARKPNGNLY